jgi:hypothetical protein
MSRPCTARAVIPPSLALPTGRRLSPCPAPAPTCSYPPHASHRPPTHIPGFFTHPLNISKYLLLIDKYLLIFAVQNKQTMSKQTRTEKILGVMYVLAWLAFIGMVVQAGAILISYGVSVANPVAAKDLYKKMDLYGLRQSNFWYYTVKVILMIALLVLKAYTAWLVVKVLSRIKLKNPFTLETAKMLERISYFILVTWILDLLHNAYTKWLSEGLAGLRDSLVLNETIFLAGVIFVIAQIFKKGVEIQSENDLTI